MLDKNLTKLSLVLAVLGLVMLTIFAYFVAPRDVKINEIGENMLGQTVKITGVVESLGTGSTIFVTVTDETGKIKVVVFERNNINGNVKETGDVSVIGKVSLYKGEIEITASLVKAI